MKIHQLVEGLDLPGRRRPIEITRIIHILEDKLHLSVDEDHRFRQYTIYFANRGKVEKYKQCLELFRSHGFSAISGLIKHRGDHNIDSFPFPSHDRDLTYEDVFDLANTNPAYIHVVVKKAFNTPDLTWQNGKHYAEFLIQRGSSGPFS